MTPPTLLGNTGDWGLAVDVFIKPNKAFIKMLCGPNFHLDLCTILLIMCQGNVPDTRRPPNAMPIIISMLIIWLLIMTMPSSKVSKTGNAAIHNINFCRLFVFAAPRHATNRCAGELPTSFKFFSMLFPAC